MTSKEWEKDLQHDMRPLLHDEAMAIVADLRAAEERAQQAEQEMNFQLDQCGAALKRVSAERDNLREELEDYKIYYDSVKAFWQPDNEINAIESRRQQHGKAT